MTDPQTPSSPPLELLNRHLMDHQARRPMSRRGAAWPAVGLIALMASVGCRAPEVPKEPAEPDAPVAPTTTELLEVFYAENGGRDAFGEPVASALEALLLSEDDIDAGDFTAARARVEGLFAEWPYDSGAWYKRAPDGLNIGDPVAYYGLRMLEHILAAGPLETSGTIQMTAIVATCATVTRPTLPDYEPETVDVELDPEILANDAQVLWEATNLFRHWVKAITGGLTVELSVVPMEGCVTVSYWEDGSYILMYPDWDTMLAGIPADVYTNTDFYWTVSPTGVPGDKSGAGFDRSFITGGMTSVRGGPLFLSDDRHFVIKPDGLGVGRYSTIERRAYQPQWFQHEFMHHLFAVWPEFGLEDSDHQWFDRSTWPEDFEGTFEPDYYSEAINKRLLGATPSLADRLAGLNYADMDELPLSAIAGDYQHVPVENDWHVVEVTVDPDARWTNQAGVSWSLVVEEGGLYSVADSPYGKQRVDVELSDAGEVSALWYGGGRYARVP
jgi:hypothetical protein